MERNETKEYSKFKFLEINRPIKESILNKLRQSISEHGVIPGRPILVDSEFNIIDGQHRFKVLKELDRSITYEIIGGNTIKKTMALNANQEHWSLEDYVSSYAKQNIDCYRQLLKFEEKHKYSFTNSMYILFGVGAKPIDLRKGKVFKVAENKDEFAEYLESLNAVPYYKSKQFILAIIVLFNNGNQKHLDKIRTSILKIPRLGTTTDYLNAIENLLNYKLRNKNNVKI